MKEIIINEDNLNINEIDEVVTRCKALIINSKNEIMIGYGNKTYQFPGGHLESGETLNECLKRELKEEVGIDIDTSDLLPFIKISYFTKNYRNTGKNRQNNIYYFYIKTDASYNKNNTDLDDYEKDANYIIKEIPLEDVEIIIKDSILDNPINEIIAKEMLVVLDYFKKTIKN